LSSRLEKIDISGVSKDLSQSSLGKGGVGLHERQDIIHLEGAERFERPMQDYYRYADDISRIFAINLGLKTKIFDTIEDLGEKNFVNDIKNQLSLKTNDRHLIDFLDQLFVNGLLEREGILENARYRNSEYTR